jgi:hypothetical protein
LRRLGNAAPSEKPTTVATIATHHARDVAAVAGVAAFSEVEER